MSLLKKTIATLTSTYSWTKEKTINLLLLNPEKGVFLPLHIKLYSSLDDILSEAEGAAWTEFTAVTTNIYENFKAKYYE
jgi:hypothetical protein